MKILNDRIRLDVVDFLKGQGKQYLASQDWIQDGNTFLQNVDPYRFLGCISPGYIPTAAVNSSAVTIKPVSAVVQSGASTPYAYLVTNGDQLHRVDLTSAPTTTTVSNTGDWPQAISTTKGAGTHNAHTGCAGEEGVLYKHNVASTPRIDWFYSWNDATDGDVGIYDFAGATFDSDYMSTTPTAGAAYLNKNPHPLIVGDDDVLYIGDGNLLKAYDGSQGANGSHYTALTLPTGYVIKGYSKTSNYLVIYAYYANTGLGGFYVSGSAKAFFWNYLDLDPTYIYDLDDNYVESGFTHKGKIGCFTYGRLGEVATSHYAKLKMFDGGKFKTIKTFAGDAPLNGGITSHANMLVWNSDGKVYYLGSPYEESSILNQSYSGSGSANGICLEFMLGTLYISSGTTTSGGLECFSTGYASNAIFQSETLIPQLPNVYARLKIKKVRIGFMFAQANTRTMDLQVVTDGSVKTIATIGTTTLVMNYERDSSGVPLPAFSKVRVNLVYAAGSAATSAPLPTYVDLFLDYKN